MAVFNESEAFSNGAFIHYISVAKLHLRPPTLCSYFFHNSIAGCSALYLQMGFNETGRRGKT